MMLIQGTLIGYVSYGLQDLSDIFRPLGALEHWTPASHATIHRVLRQLGRSSGTGALIWPTLHVIRR